MVGAAHRERGAVCGVPFAVCRVQAAYRRVSTCPGTLAPPPKDALRLRHHVLPCKGSCTPTRVLHPNKGRAPCKGSCTL